MTLTPPVLDDLTWDAMVEAAKRRIPAESLGEWTLHAPVDPGITLVELLAYLLEQQLFRLDQVPDELVVAVLSLLGVAGPRPAVPATTVLELGASEPCVVAAGAVLSRDPLERVTFTLLDDVAVLPFDSTGTRLIVGGSDRSADLAAGRGVPLLPSTGEAAEFRVVLRRSDLGRSDLGRSDTTRPPAGARLSLLFELDAGVRSPASWSPLAVGDVPPPAELIWSWFRPGDEDEEARIRDVADGTAGLRRSGIVTLPLPNRPWTELGLRVRTRAATYASPSVLLALVPNSGAAAQRETRTAAGPELSGQVAAWLRLPGQHLELPDARGRLLDADVRVFRGGEGQEWEQTTALTFAGPADRLFLLDRENGELRFGDGLTGAIPVPDQPDAVEAEYTLGGGAAGNGGRTANWFVLRGAPEGVLVTARNPVPAEGGTDPETVAAARSRAGDELAEVTRAVTAADFEDLAVSTPGVAVARAHAGIGSHPEYPGTPVPGAVTVRVVPDVRRDDTAFAADDFVAAVRPDPGLLAAVLGRLACARLIGTELFVCPPRYRRADLRVTLATRPADPASVIRALRVGLRRFLDPVVGDDGEGWPFGGPLRPSALRKVAQEAVGEAADVTAVAIGLDGKAAREDCTDVPVRPGELVAAGDMAVDVAKECGR